MRHTRRNVIASIATLSAGGIGYTIATDKATAQTNLNITEFTIPDTEKEIVDPVASARLNVSADYSIEAEKQPTRVILRLEGKRSGEYTQLAATELTGLEQSMSGTQDLEGNLLDLPNVEAVDLSPSTQGETKSMDLSIRLKMTVKRNGSTLSENTVEDMVSINVTKGTASASISIGGSGSVSISES